MKWLINCDKGPNIFIYIRKKFLSEKRKKIVESDFSLAVEKNHFSGTNRKYTYIKQPSISSISPSCGPTFGETQITVRGEHKISYYFNKIQFLNL